MKIPVNKAKPCPFCGSLDIHHYPSDFRYEEDAYCLRCNNCEATGPETWVSDALANNTEDNLDLCLLKWNTRMDVEKIQDI